MIAMKEEQEIGFMHDLGRGNRPLPFSVKCLRPEKPNNVEIAGDDQGS